MHKPSEFEVLDQRVVEGAYLTNPKNIAIDEQTFVARALHWSQPALTMCSFLL